MLSTSLHYFVEKIVIVMDDETYCILSKRDVEINVRFYVDNRINSLDVVK